MHSRADTANALRPDPCLARIAPAQNQLDAAKHSSRAPGIGDRTAVHFGFNAQMAFNTSHWIDYDTCHTFLLCLLLYFLGSWGSPHAVPDCARDAMDGCCSRDRRSDPDPDLPGADVCSKSRHIRETFIKWRFSLPEVVPSAADAAMARLHGPTGAIVKAHGRAVERCLRAFAPHLVEAPATPVSFVTPLLHVAAGVEVSTPLALIVDDASISKERPVVLIHRWQLPEREVVHQHRRGIRRILRASTQVDDLGLRHGLRNAHGAGGIRRRTHQPAVPGASSSRNRCRCIGANVFRDGECRLAGDSAVHPVIGKRDRAFHYRQVL